jgi:hypothetical protein
MACLIQTCSKQGHLILCSIISGLLTGLYPLPSQGQISQAIIEEVIDSNEVYIEQQPAKVEDRANFGQQIATKAALAGLIFNNGASGRLGHHSSMIVGQCIEVSQGELLVSGPVNGCVAEMTVIVQGTVYTLEKTSDGSGLVKVIEGRVEVEERSRPGRRRLIREGEWVRIRRGMLSSPEQIPEAELVKLFNGPLFSRFKRPVLSRKALQALCQRRLPNFECSPDGKPLRPRRQLQRSRR